jgi:4-hydroxyacetophenone monooxygenase
MVLILMTGDQRWLNPKYHVHRPRGISDNDTGGLPEEIQSEIREAAAAVIGDWMNGMPIMMNDPPEQFLAELLEFCIGEKVPPEYGPMIKGDLLASGALGGQRALMDPTGAVPPGMSAPPSDFLVVIIGAGVSGLTTAMAFEAAGIDYMILEKHDTVGGTWYENRYPGAGVDTPNHLYSWPGVPNDWAHYFSLRDEIHSYIEKVSMRGTIRSRIRFDTEVKSVVLDEEKQTWTITAVGPTGEPQTLVADVVISAVGLFNQPNVVDLSGANTFKGQSFHTARWPEKYDAAGRDVVIVGNGASSMQVVPRLAPVVNKLTIFQRSAQWAAPFEKFEAEVPEGVRALIQEVPLYRWVYRIRLMWMFNDRFWKTLEVDPDWPHPERSVNATNDKFREIFIEYITEQLADRPDLLPKVIPTYPPYGKRILLDNGWYQALKRDNVELVTTAIDHVGPHSVTAVDGTEYPADTLIYSTGFQAVRFLSTYELIGRGGKSVRQIWDDDDARAYLGTVIPSFPNFFCLYGPNLQGGHGGTFMTIAAAQVRYILSVLDQMFRRNLTMVEIRQDICDAYNEEVDKQNARRIWTHKGMTTYYRNSKGRVTVNRPFRNVDFWTWTRDADLSEFLTWPTTTETSSGERFAASSPTSQDLS